MSPAMKARGNKPSVRMLVTMIVMAASFGLIIAGILSLQDRADLRVSGDQDVQEVGQFHNITGTPNTDRVAVISWPGNVLPQEWRSMTVEIDRIKGVPIFNQTDIISSSDGSPEWRSKPVNLSITRNETNFNKYLDCLKQELSVYPAELLEKSGLRAIALCSEMDVNGRKVGGLAVTSLGIVFFTAQRHTERRSPRRAIHHEIFHMIETKQDAARAWKDPAWEDLNHETFRYGREEIDQMTPGFLTKYSRSAVQEDKAIVYSHMITDSDYLEGLFLTDKILHSKCKELKGRLSDFSQEFDEAFWEKARHWSRD